MSLQIAGSTWVSGDSFFNRTHELDNLARRATNRIHTLLTAPRRMGKTSLVREFLRRKEEDETFETIFVNLEHSSNVADAIAEIITQSSKVKSTWDRLSASLSSVVKDIGERLDSISIADLKVQLRAGITDKNQWQEGDKIFSSLSKCEKPVVLAIDELPIFINRLLRGDGDKVTQEGINSADMYLSWLRKNAQEHRDNVVLILSGSVGLEPILRRVGLSAHANVYNPLELKAWPENVAVNCLAELSKSCGIKLPLEVREAMCRRLRHHIPQHVQRFFGHMLDYLTQEGRFQATLEDVDEVYNYQMLSVRGQVDLEHYPIRLRMILAINEYKTALELLTEASVNDGLLTFNSINLYRSYIEKMNLADEELIALEDILYLFEHDGYMEREEDGYRFVSGLLEDWWRVGYGQFHVPVQQRLNPAPDDRNEDERKPY